MRQIIEVLRLKHEVGLSHDRIARACGLSKGVVGKYVSQAQAKGITWPLPEDADEAWLEVRLFPVKAPPSRFAEPDDHRAACGIPRRQGIGGIRLLRRLHRV